MIKFDVTKQEAHLCFLIAKRAKNAGLSTNQLATEMDVTAVHVNGCKLDLEFLLTCKDEDFSHDVMEISQHIDRNTGRLNGLFTLRCAARSAHA